MSEPEKIKLESMDIAREKREQLKNLFPEIFDEDSVDYERLKTIIGGVSDDEPTKERFGLNWHGKVNCLKIIQQPSIATLKPTRDESVNFDETENLFIEGDNLEVLKLLQKSYFGKVKMIYIDPPYNTGKEFIYPDKFSETLETYLAYTGQKDAEGRKFSTNTDTTGRYHSNWLNMIYPRLYLAKNILMDNGVIFISIDDNESSNLKKICDEIFGEGNFIAKLVWKSKSGGASDSKHFINEHEYILCYAKNIEYFDTNLDKDYEINDSNYPFEDEKGKYGLVTLDKSSLGYIKSLDFEIKDKDGNSYYPRVINGEKSRWRWGKKKVKENYDELIFKDGKVYTKFYKPEGIKPKTLMVDERFGRTSSGGLEIKKLFNKKVFSYPKPSDLILYLLKIASKSNSIILDFFAGSSTTAHAVMELNQEDRGNRKFIMVQLPEPIKEDSLAYKEGYKTIADIGKERIRLSAKKIEKETNKKLDLGFKVFKLDKSNFKVWESNIDKIEDFQQQLINHVNHISDSSTQEDILYELLLKSGFPLTTKVEKIQMAGKEVFSINKGSLLICLEKKLTQEIIDAIAEANPQQVICLDDGFQGNDQLKTNAVYTFKTRAQEQEREIVFKTV